MNSRSSAFSWTKSIAKRSGTRTVPSIESVAPRWELIGAQQPLAATQPGPRSGGATSMARAWPTRVGTPMNSMSWSGCAGLLSVIVKPWVSSLGAAAPLSYVTSMNRRALPPPGIAGPSPPLTRSRASSAAPSRGGPNGVPPARGWTWSIATVAGLWLTIVIS